MKIVEMMANNSSVPYFRWMADRAAERDDIEMIFVALCRDRPDMIDEMEARGCDCRWVPFDSSRRKVEMPLSVARLYRLFRELKPDVVHTHLFDDSLPGLLAARMARVPCRVVNKQDAGVHLQYHPRMVYADRFNNWNATVIHSVGDRNRGLVLNQERAPERKVRVVRHGVDLDEVTHWDVSRREHFRRSYDLQSRIVVGTVARFVEWKGHRLILDAARQLVRKEPRLCFVWAGFGGADETADLQSEIENTGLADHVRLVGWVERAHMPSLYRSFDLYLHPARQEPFGFALAEAFLNGVPVVATRMGANDLAVPQSDYWLLSEDSPSDIVEAIETLLANPDRCSEMAEAGRRQALRNHDFQRMFEEHLSELYGLSPIDASVGEAA